MTERMELISKSKNYFFGFDRLGFDYFNYKIVRYIKHRINGHNTHANEPNDDSRVNSRIRPMP